MIPDWKWFCKETAVIWYFAPVKKIEIAIINSLYHFYGCGDTSLVKIEIGEHGLFYAVDTENNGVFIVAASAYAAERLAKQALDLLKQGHGEIECHTLHTHDDGWLITIPDPEWMTPPQRGETMDRLRDHIKNRCSQ